MGMAPSLLKLDRFTDAITSGSVQITVGKDDNQKIFSIHRGLLSQETSALEKMFSGYFKEGIDGEATLPNDSPKAFEVFSTWLYVSVITHPSYIIRELFSGKQTREVRWKMVETIAFADKYCLDKLGDMVISVWFKYQMVALPLEELKEITSYIVANSSPRCKARDFFAFIWATEVIADDYSYDDLDSFITDPEFAKDVIRELAFLTFPESKELRTACNFHHHDESPYCCGLKLKWEVQPVDSDDSTPTPIKKRKSN
ncbi:hypothetical protein V490_03714 [Pseudogymnoascus sp. VKM F-3557]|nr:hypothetical protein V490_03714 [Pseudogymnoascus sp. VKM F-3557]